MPIRRRTSTGSTPDAYRSWPWKLEIGRSDRYAGMRSFIRFIVRRSVDLPHPDGPMSAVICCFATLRSTFRTARNEP